MSAAVPLYFARARARWLVPTALTAFLSALAPWPGTLLALVPRWCSSSAARWPARSGRAARRAAGCTGPLRPAPWRWRRARVPGSV
ncbi:hypothetical protein ACFQV4_14915 [Streptomyces thermocarboxydus]